MFEIVVPNRDQIEDAAEHMLPEDVKEIRVMDGWTPREALEGSILNSIEYHAFLYRGAVIAVYGIRRDREANPKGEDWYRPWCLTTKISRVYRVAFLKTYRKVLDDYAKRYRRLVTVVPEFRSDTIRWLSHNGFVLWDEAELKDGETAFLVVRNEDLEDDTQQQEVRDGLGR
jgi:hypothetical protein